MSAVPLAERLRPTNLDQVMRRIERLEADYAALEADASKIEFQQDLKKLSEMGQKMASLQSEIHLLYEELEGTS